MRGMTIRVGLGLSVLVAVCANPDRVAAQGDEPLFGRLTSQFKQPYLSFGMLLQTVADYQFDRSFAGSNGFTIANARFSIAGQLDQGFGYFLQTNFAGTPAILDAYLTYDISSALSLRVGQFKAPFSAEFLTSASSIDFVNRSQTVTALAAGRQLGGQVEIALGDRGVGATLGVFNGNGTAPNGNDSDDLMYAGRVFLNAPIGAGTGDQARLAFNLAHSEDVATAISGVVGSFSGGRTLIGFDVRATIGQELLSGEVIFAALDPSVGAQRDPWGFHVTFGHSFATNLQGLLRWDRFDTDGPGDPTNLIVAGLNVWPTLATEFQINYLIDTDNADVDQHQFLVNFQINF